MPLMGHSRRFGQVPAIVRPAPINRHCQNGPAGPFGARSGRRAGPPEKASPLFVTFRNPPMRQS